MTAPSTQTPILDRPTLLALRWAGTVVLVAALAAGYFGRMPFPGLPVALGVLAAGVALNLLMHRDNSEPIVGLVLLLDVWVLTGLLASSGGAANPFTLLYLLPVLLAALVLPPAWTALIAVASMLGFASLLLTSDTHVHSMDMTQHLIGMLVAYIATVPIIGAALHRFRAATAQAEEEARRARTSLEQGERLASLAALAGGAAHELATPLSTILLIASELKPDVDPSLHSELDALEAEVKSCRAILDQLAVEVGSGHGEAARTVELRDFLSASLERTVPGLHLEAPTGLVRLPTGLVARALRLLVGNARDAHAATVTVRAERTDDRVRFQVIDDGDGMEPEVLARACEPFFTTKTGHEGRGLGLFFVCSLAHQLGGDLSLEAEPGRGTRVQLDLPDQEGGAR